MRCEGWGVPETRAIEGGRTHELPEGVGGDGPEERERGDADGRKAVGQGKRDVECDEFGEKEGAGHGMAEG